MTAVYFLKSHIGLCSPGPSPDWRRTYKSVLSFLYSLQAPGQDRLTVRNLGGQDRLQKVRTGKTVGPSHTEKLLTKCKMEISM